MITLYSQLKVLPQRIEGLEKGEQPQKLHVSDSKLKV